MLTSKTQYSLSNAKTYFSEHLSVGDYYAGERHAGRWFGAGAMNLGLTGDVGEAEFLKLCDNLNPVDDGLLTQRRKTVRKEVGADGKEMEVANRRVFYDFTISTPKSVSIVALIAGDRRIVEAHDRAAQVAMRELEEFTATRIRSKDRYGHRTTGNAVGAAFRHDTSRALDPHLHTHCIFFNATFDPEEKRWKALENIDMLRAKKYAEGVYYHELARSLRELGYEIENQARGDFEIRGVSKELCDRFSKRHQEIEKHTADFLERCPEMADGNIAEIREHIAHARRSRKIKDIPLAQLQARWEDELSLQEARAMMSVVHQKPSAISFSTEGQLAEAAISWAEEHLFERKSVIRERDLWRVALEHVRGEAVSIDAIKAVSRKRDYIRYHNDPGKITTEELLSREIEIVTTAREGANSFEALTSYEMSLNTRLDDGQRAAVAQILASRDFITLFRGGAGTGKSFALKEVETQLRHAGRRVHVVAPQRQQVMDLVRDGFSDPKTLSEFLMASSVRDGDVVVVDEAGQIGARQMQTLFEKVEARGGRILLSGDTRQHGAVEASDALWAIEKYSGLRAAEIGEIRRQDPEKAHTSAEHEFIKGYKKAVEDAASGDLTASFQKLDEIGAILECPIGEQQQWLAAYYTEQVRKGGTPLVVAQTWNEIHKLNNSIRESLKTAGLLPKRERIVTALERVDLTEAQKKDARFYSESTVIVFNRNAAGFKKGETAKLLSISHNGIIVENDARVRLISNRFLGHFVVCEPKELPLAKGDRLQLRANAQIGQGQRLANGELVVVESVRANGAIILKDGRVVPPRYRQFGRGYAVTSYASQGKTVDHVLFSDSAIQAATSAQQWYVSISRARRGIRIFTADKEQLREGISQMEERSLALDISAGREQQMEEKQALPGYRIFPGIKTLAEYASMIRLRKAAWDSVVKRAPQHQQQQQQQQSRRRGQSI